MDSIERLGTNGTDKNYLKQLEVLKTKVIEGKLTVEQLQNWIECEKALLGKCFSCSHVNEFGGGACWSCDD